MTANEGSNDVSVLLGLGDGTFIDALAFAVPDQPWPVAAADFDGNGFADLATAGRSAGAVSVLLNDGEWGSGPGPGLDGLLLAALDDIRRRPTRPPV